MKKVFITILCLANLSFYQVIAQEHHESLPNKRLAVFIGHTLIPRVSSQQKVLIPSYGLDFDYWLNSTIGIGLHGDIEIESFIVKKSGSEEISRLYPLVLSLDALYSPYKGLIIQAGPGVEIDPGKSFTLARVGIEYEIQIGNHWDLAPTFFYDHRFNNFDTWTFALGVGKRF